MSTMHVTVHVRAVVMFGFHQRQYTFLEGVGDAEVCVDRNGSIATSVNLTVDGSEFCVLFMPHVVKIVIN